MTDLKETIRQCTNCHLHKAHNGPVPGHFAKPFGLLIIGEAPGHEEDIGGIPFVGKTGRYLRGKLKEFRFPFPYISFANAISCRPTGKDNRDPREEELFACRNNILSQIAHTKPRVILTVGKISSRLFYPNIRLQIDHGRPVWLSKNRIQIPTYHPAFILRKKTEWEHVFDADLVEVKKKLYDENLGKDWPTTCRVCKKDVEQYDKWGLAYCTAHYMATQKVLHQPGML